MQIPEAIPWYNAASPAAGRGKAIQEWERKLPANQARDFLQARHRREQAGRELVLFPVLRAKIRKMEKSSFFE
jgi:hypothetical protein